MSPDIPCDVLLGVIGVSPDIPLTHVDAALDEAAFICRQLRNEKPFDKQVKEYALAEIFEAVTTMTPSNDSAPTLLFEDYKSDSTTTTTTTTTTTERQSEADDATNNETLRKKSKKHHKANGEKSSLLKSLVAEYSRDERAKKNRRGRKSANLSE